MYDAIALTTSEFYQLLQNIADALEELHSSLIAAERMMEDDRLNATPAQLECLSRVSTELRDNLIQLSERMKDLLASADRQNLGQYAVLTDNLIARIQAMR